MSVPLRADANQFALQERGRAARLPVRLFPLPSGDSFQLDARVDGRNSHVLDYFQTAGERGLVLLRLIGGVVPNLAVCTLAIPAKIPVRNRLERQELKTAQQHIIFRDVDLAAADLYFYQFFVRLEDLVIGHFWRCKISVNY